MLRLLHILHPIRTAKNAYRRLVVRPINDRLARRQFQKVERGQVARCWCGGGLLPFSWHSSFGVCADCGTYVNRRPPTQESLEKIYSLNQYWRRRQRLKGYPEIAGRSALYRLDGRLDHWLSLIDKFAPSARIAIEVGCAPGVLLQALSERGLECVGVEISGDVADWMRRETGLDIRAGFFPGVQLPACNLFLAFDVLEHSPCPLEFMHEVSRLLTPGGIAIIQTAVDRYDFEPPFGERFDMFDDVEHLYLFTNDSVRKLAALAQLEVLDLKERIWLAGEVCVFRKVGLY